MAKKHPVQVPGLAAYMAQIVQASGQFRGNPWVEYDTRRRMQAAAAGQTNLAEVDTSLWAIAFANAEPREECRRCSSLDHVSAQSVGTTRQGQIPTTKETAPTDL